MRSFDRDIGEIIARLQRHATAADQTAVATELVKAAEYRRETERQREEELKIQCRRWLNPADVKHIHHHQIQVRLDGTCEWIISNDIFKRWVESSFTGTQDRLLTISGPHGCGKSVLASSVVVRLEKPEQHVLFFAFSGSDSSRKTSENLVRTLLWQLLHKSTKKGSVNIIQSLRSDGQPTISELWDALGKITSSLAQPVYCIIDGLDECADLETPMFENIVRILEQSSNLRVVLLGRPHVIRVQVNNLSAATIVLTPTVLNQDIEAFIHNEIAKSDVLSLTELRERVFQILKDKSDGMFLWVRLMVDDLRKSASLSECKERLQNLPRGLEKAYQLVFLRLTQKLDSFERRLAQNTLAFTTTAYRPLHFDELRCVHALLTRPSESVAQPLEEYLLLLPPQRVLDVCGGLVTIANGFLRLTHSSVKDFLVRPEQKWVCGFDRSILEFRVDVTQIHRRFAWLCLDYLKLEKRSLGLDISQSLEMFRKNCPLLEYATMYIFFHLNRSNPPCLITSTKIKDVIESKEIISWVEHFAHYVFEDPTFDPQVREFMAFGDRWADTDPGKSLLATFENRVREEVISRMRYSAMNRDTHKLELMLVLINDFESETHGQNQSREPTEIVPEPCAIDVPQTRFPNSKSSSKHIANTVARIRKLLNGQTSPIVAHQIEIFLRLKSCLDKTGVLIDPLTVLFKLILGKASGVSVYVLLAIGRFYYKLEKFDEALDVFSAAVKKVDHLDVPLKFEIYAGIADCYHELSIHGEALRFYGKAFLGQRILLGDRHRKTFYFLVRMMWEHRHLSQDREMLRLCEQICHGQDFAPELSIVQNIQVQSLSMVTYGKLGDFSKAARAKEYLRATMRKYDYPCPKDTDEFEDGLFTAGQAYDYMHDRDRALKSLQLALNAKKNAGNKRRTLLIQCWMATVHESLGHYEQAKGLCELVYAEQLKTLGSGHLQTRWTKEALDRFDYYDSGDYGDSDHYDYISNDPYNREDSPSNIPYALPGDIQCRAFKPYNGSDFEISPRRNSADF